MIKQIRTSKATKVIACYLALIMFIEMLQPLRMYALTEGPSQPEFNSFTPIGTSDMVDLTSGDFNYNIPIMDVGGYPINLSYNSGVTMDQEASWVGLGWNLNVGQINRDVRGLPDDFKGDIITNKNNLKTNVTVGVNPYINFQVIGALDGGLSIGAGVDVQLNNYRGMSAVPSFGASFKFNDYVSVGMQLSSSVDEGASVTPSVSLSSKRLKSEEMGEQFSGTISPSITYNTRQGLQSFNLSSSLSYQNHGTIKDKEGKDKINNLDVGRSGTASYSFLNTSFTPGDRLAFKNNNFRFSFSTGPDVMGAHVEGSIAGYASIQSLIDPVVKQASYGYQYSDFASTDDLLDFNREKDQGSVSKNTLVLPVTNYTYDLYSIQGQGVGGMFRPFRGQIGYVRDGLVTDRSSSASAGVELEVGVGGHTGYNARTSNTTSYTGGWETNVTPFLKEKTTNNQKDYEKTYFKSVGEIKRDDEGEGLLNSMGEKLPVTLKIDETRNALNTFSRKQMVGIESELLDLPSFTSQIKRQNREIRNRVIQKITKAEALRYGLSPFIKYNTQTAGFTTGSGGSSIPIPLVPGHHTAGYIITNSDASRYIYGETAYNKEKKEVSFAVNGNNGSIDRKNGLVKYDAATDNSPSNTRGRDHYFNSVTTPAYAHTYLLTSVLSPDYQDLTRNGPTDDDLGTYTKFIYSNKGDYKWRVPYGKKMTSEVEGPQNWASYNEGLKVDKMDQKGSYLYGTRENKYLKRIETKTHIAFFILGDRRDSYGVKDENGGGLPGTAAKMYRIDRIELYSKPDALQLIANGMVPIPGIFPIKTAHFKYDYSLCKGIDNNSGVNQIEGGVDTNLGEGKLTLKRVYFTYGSSNMGQYTPYKFDYGEGSEEKNPDYNVKAYDIWGNYKPFIETSWADTSNDTTPQEFPYVNQGESNREDQDDYASSWSLRAIDLPSGGRIEMQYEADDYQYVQNKRAMQMFKVDGVTKNIVGYSSGQNSLYSGSDDAKYVVINVAPEYLIGTPDEDLIIKRYTEGLEGKPIYFNFLMNLTEGGGQYEYINGYFEMDGSAEFADGKLFIPMKHINREGKNSGSDLVNPISVAGWFFGRQNLNPQMNGIDDPGGTIPGNVLDLGKSIWDNLKPMSEIFIGANRRLRDQLHIAKNFKPKKSWIRLLEPSGSKIGGGCRVKNVIIRDGWEKMLDISESSEDIPRYAKKYGQEYNYDLEDGKSSGVATYEPNISKENPLIMPFYHKPEKLTMQTYQETPFGESFFPAPTVTYSRVAVHNITAGDDMAGSRKTKSGEVITYHYTSRDFPTITDYTNLDKSKEFKSNEKSQIDNMLRSIIGLKISTYAYLTMTQGFVVETNDMNGKLKMQEVYDNGHALISSVEYKYRTKEGKLDNEVVSIDEKGKISTSHELGVEYDVVNDLRESYSKTESYGMAVNGDVIPLGIFPIIIGWAAPERSTHKQTLRTAVTTKVINRFGILEKTIAKDLNSVVSTENLAWEANTGQVILTKTVNEYDDSYYSFNYPAYWNYRNMGHASRNIDLSGTLVGVGGGFFSIEGLTPATDIVKYLSPGDEIIISQSDKTMWVTGYNSENNAVSLMNSRGEAISTLATNDDPAPDDYNTKFRVLRSTYRNMLDASMASVTLMRNPIMESVENITESLTFTEAKVINASAIEYSDNWPSQCENGLPGLLDTDINQYLYNVRGNWKPYRSYAYLTGRESSPSAYTRKAGFFKQYFAFYSLDTEDNWTMNTTDPNWKFASQITAFVPYGAEVENRDALNRFSSAQYGYAYKLPTAVASNSQYKEMGFDGFEDYDPANWTTPSALRPHFGYNDVISANASISGTTSHTGRKSIKVNGNTRVTLTRKTHDCEAPE